MKHYLIFFMICSIIFISFPGMSGIPLEEGMTSEEVDALYEKMQRQKEEIAREIWEKKQKKIEEIEKEKQPIKEVEAPIPTQKKEKPSAKKEKTMEEQAVIEEEKAISTLPSEGVGKGIVPGVVIPEEEIEQDIKIEKKEKLAQEVKYKMDFSFILVIVVMLTTIVFLIRSMSGERESKKRGEG